MSCIRFIGADAHVFGVELAGYDGALQSRVVRAILMTVFALSRGERELCFLAEIEG
jgi:hypothetical protein